jgi:molecular chaperone GrpE
MIIEKDLVSIFEKNRIKKIETEGKKFDPNFHQAMTEINDDTTEPGTILQEIQAGYMFGERLLRPSLVGVAKKNEENEDKKEQK